MANKQSLTLETTMRIHLACAWRASRGSTEAFYVCQPYCCTDVTEINCIRSKTLGVPMRKMIRPFAAVVYIACLAVSNFVISNDRAMAQDQVAPPPVKQMALTKKQIEGVLAAQKDMDAVTEKMSDNVPPDPKVTAQLESAARKNGFASYDEYNNVVDNISLVLAGFDPTTKKYIGSDAVIRAQIAQVQADKNMPAKDKVEALADLNAALKSPAPPIENKGNIDLVATYYDKLADAMGNDQQ
jgi:hypothetical protein